MVLTMNRKVVMASSLLFLVIAVPLANATSLGFTTINGNPISGNSAVGIYGTNVICGTAPANSSIDIAGTTHGHDRAKANASGNWCVSDSKFTHGTAHLILTATGTKISPGTTQKAYLALTIP